jgi:hypothetical protein
VFVIGKLVAREQDPLIVAIRGVGNDQIPHDDAEPLKKSPRRASVS